MRSPPATFYTLLGVREDASAEEIRSAYRRRANQFHPDKNRDYAVIVAVADKIPNNVLEEDPKLLMWYDQAVTRMGGE